ncbi:MAG: GNAT family N-acetyltransferase [Candidatus Marinimicrobia bacterium]|nr:GNAT family N-acetyltransferase [Candidatus Neomarinimicrobiota bacterium]MCF7830138.1 GNAT family N-acetyltransferase [Candidatus Neomarinimicrobiota bacterium]MCF7882215.1 GNAT family N-acetyltransferase [Candidatus Neomarinimicrobiota bacterium]
MNITVRRARRKDAGYIADYNIAMARETEDKSLDKNTVIRGVQSLMETPEYGFYLVAEVDGKVAGCLLITYEWSDWRNGLFWWIQSVYVAPEHRGQGVFRSMYEYVERSAREDETVCGLRLYVEDENERAQSTYRALGMERTGYQLWEEEF